MEKQTAVEWFAIQLYEQGYFNGSTPKSITNLDHLQEQAKQMEKEQIITAYLSGSIDVTIDEIYGPFFYKEDAIKYYKLTYKTK